MLGTTKSEFLSGRVCLAGAVTCFGLWLGLALALGIGLGLGLGLVLGLGVQG